MHKSFSDLTAKTMSKDARKKAHLKARKELAEMELADLRSTLRIRQSDLAKKMKCTQAAISRIESRKNVLLNTLTTYIENMGGKLELHAVFPERTVKLTHLIAEAEKQEEAAAR